MTTPKPFRGELWWVDWSPARGSEPDGRRPSLIVQHDLANQSSSYRNTIIVAVSTAGLPISIHVPLAPTRENGLTAPSFVKCEQILTISCDRLCACIGQITPDEMRRVDAALRKVLGLP